MDEQEPSEQGPSEQSVKEETEKDTENVVPSPPEVSTTNFLPMISSNEPEPKPPVGASRERKSSAFADSVVKIADRFKKRFSSLGKGETGISSNTEETTETPSEPLRVNIVEPSRESIDVSNMKNIPDEDDNKRKSVLKRLDDSGMPVGSAPVKFSPDVEISKPRPRKSYNPFSNFEKNIPISNPRATKGSAVSGISGWGKSYSIASSYQRDSNVSGINERGKRSVSVVDLSKQNIAFCFFPEEPDWDEDDDDDDRARRYTTNFGPDGDHQDKDFEWSERDRWESRLVYLMALISYSISFSNIYNFPLLVYTYSGFFLIPYTIFTIIFGYPLHFLESSLGQYSQSGPVKVWDCAPIARGVGWSMFLLCCFMAYYYNMYGAYSVIYFSRCFSTILPWLDCDESAVANNYSCVPRMCASSQVNINQYSPAEHYFVDHVLRLKFPDGVALSSGLGSMMFTHVLGFFFAWFVVYVAIIQGIRSIGKCVYFLVALPYFVLLMMLTAGFLLEGSSQSWFLLFGASGRANLFDIQMWRSAAEQVFFELGISQGIPLVYGSYCHHRNPTHKDSAIICIINYCTSLLCALVFFNILGALATEMGNPAEMVSRKSAGLVFIMYSDALCRIPGSNFWCVIFFLMLFSVIIGTQIAIVETIMTVIYDEFPNALPYRWFINLLVCCGLFLIGLVLCTSNGYFVVHMLDRMTGAMPRLPIAVCSAGAIVFIYGLRKFSEDVHFMIDYFPNLFLRGCLFITPFLLIALTLASWVSIKNFTIFGLQYYPGAINVGWFTVWFILAWIPIGVIYWMLHCYLMGQFKLLFNSLNSWGPQVLSARIARTEFSSDHVDNFTNSWIKRQSSTYVEED